MKVMKRREKLCEDGEFGESKEELFGAYVFEVDCCFSIDTGPGKGDDFTATKSCMFNLSADSQDTCICFDG